VRPLTRALGAMLMLGTALLGVGAVVHPVLAGDAAAQLRTMADSEHWRAIHLGMLAGTGLVMVGIWVRMLLEPVERRAALGAALTVISIGMTINGLNIAYMAGSGLHLAGQFAAGNAMGAPLFDATHPIGLMAARFGNFLVALGAVVLGAAEWGEQGEDRLRATLAWIAAAGGLVGAMFFEESSRIALAAVALLSGWQLVVAARALRSRAER
jgi:hypothetical protein